MDGIVIESMHIGCRSELSEPSNNNVYIGFMIWHNNYVTNFRLGRKYIRPGYLVIFKRDQRFPVFEQDQWMKKAFQVSRCSSA